MKKILIVDDSQTIRTMCVLIHKGLEDKILTAASAAEAERVIASEHPDVIFADYTLPDGDVYDFISRHSAGKCGVVMMGGKYAACDADRAKASGAVDVVIKPFRTEDFFAAEDRAYTHAQGAEASAPAAAHSTENTTIPPMPSPTQSGIPSAPKIGGTVPPLPQGRFNMPGSPSSPSNPSISPQAANGASSVSNLIMVPSEQAATPTNPNPPVSEPSIQTQAMTDNSAAIRAEVIAVLKVMLPPMINSYVKKLIQAEVKPQLQSWVDSRVETIIRNLSNQ